MTEIKKEAVPPRKPIDYSQVLRNHRASKTPLGAFMVQPQSVKMGILEADEQVLLLLRRHFITNFNWIAISLIMFVAPIILSSLPWINFLPSRFMVATIFLWYLMVLGIALNGFLSWYYNVFVITDERVIDVDFLNLIYKNVSTAKIDNIEDVTIQMGGATRSILNFGTVYIQTAAEKNQFEFEDVPLPQEVAKLLNELILEEQQEELEGRAK